MTGIAFNVILVRSSAQRDKQFTTFDQTTVLDQRAGNTRSYPGQNKSRTVELDGSTTLRSNGFAPSQTDVELGVKSISSEDQQSGFYLGGIKVATNVVRS
jgi:hypothetical protein